MACNRTESEEQLVREIVAVCAILGGIIEMIATIGGPQLAGVGMVSGDPAPPIETVPLIVGLATAGVAIAAGSLVGLGRNAQVWGALIIASVVIGVSVVGPSTGFYTMGAAFTLLGGVLSLFIRRRRRAVP